MTGLFSSLPLPYTGEYEQMYLRTVTSLLLLGVLAAPLPSLALYHTSPGRSDLAPGQTRRDATVQAPTPSPTAVFEVRPRGLLRQEKHAARLERVLGIVRGMTNKLTNLSNRLAKHLTNVERRITALQAAGHTIAVDAELAAARTAVQALQDKIASAIREIDALADSEKPRAVIPTVRKLLRDIRSDLRAVRTAFQTLRLAIRADVRAKPSPSPLAPPTPSPTPSPIVSP